MAGARSDLRSCRRQPGPAQHSLILSGYNKPNSPAPAQGGRWLKLYLPLRAQECRRNAGFSMRYTDIAIIGGGLAGSAAAAMLGRAGISTIVIDPHKVYPFDFRVEKIGGEQQVERFLKTGI